MPVVGHPLGTDSKTVVAGKRKLIIYTEKPSKSDDNFREDAATRLLSKMHYTHTKCEDKTDTIVTPIKSLLYNNFHRLKTIIQHRRVSCGIYGKVLRHKRGINMYTTPLSEGGG
jgi:hypothetical protein